MMTVRQIERLWDTKACDKLFTELTSIRPEGAFRLGVDTSAALPAAAMAVIRLDELDQSHVKLYTRLIRAILAAQQLDGGWGDLLTTALCLRALFRGTGDGAAIERGLAYLAGLQKSEGIWPGAPIRRMPADPYVSALILYQLADQPRFRQSVRLADASQWFASHAHSIDAETRRLWTFAQGRFRIRPVEMTPNLC